MTEARRCQSCGARSSGIPMSAIEVAPTITASTRKLPNAASTPATAASIDALPRTRRGSSAIGRSLTSVLPSDRPARIRELVEARRVLSGAVRDLKRLTRDLEADLARLSAQRSHTQREVLAYEAVAGEIEEVLLRWDARREQLSATIERGNRRQGRGEGRPGAAPSGRPGAPSGRPGAPGGRQGRPGGTQGKGGGTQGRNAGGQE